MAIHSQPTWRKIQAAFSALKIMTQEIMKLTESIPFEMAQTIQLEE